MIYFKVSELFVHCSRRERTIALLDDNILQNLFILFVVLQQLRVQLAMPIYINSCYRDEEHNKNAGGVKGSHHIKGAAADIRCDKKYMEKLLKFCFDNIYITQIILYDTFVHISIHPSKNKRFYDKRTVKQNQ